MPSLLFEQIDENAPDNPEILATKFSLVFLNTHASDKQLSLLIFSVASKH